MTYDRTIIAYDRNGVSQGDLSLRCTKATCNLSARRGCGGGTLSMLGGVRDDFELEEGYAIEMGPNSGNIVWRGIVIGRRRTLGGNVHEYEMRGAWARIQNRTTSQRHTHEAALVSDIVSDLATTYLNFDASEIASFDITASTITVDAWVAEEDRRIDDLLEGLELLASADGQHWVSGVDAQKRFYFKPIPSGDPDLQAVYTITGDAIKATEDVQTSGIANRAMVRGAVIPAKGLIARWPFEDAASITARGETRRYEVPVRTVWKKTDLQQVATGYFMQYASREVLFDGIERMDLDTDTPPLPWAGYLRYYDPQRGDLGRTPITRIRVELGNRPAYQAEVGFEDPRESNYAPSIEREVYNDYDIDNYELYPPVTDVDDAWYQPPYTPNPIDPATGQPITTPEDLAQGVGLPRGFVIDFKADSGPQPDDRIGASAWVSKGNDDTDFLSVTFRFYQYDSGGGLVASQSIAGVKQSTLGALEYWTLPADPQTWYLARAGFGDVVYIHVIVVDDDSPDFTTYDYPPGANADPKQGYRYHIIDDDGSVTTPIFKYATWISQE